MEFEAQINCVCNRNCAQQIDVLRQRDIFDEYKQMNDNTKTRFLASLAIRYQVQKNSHPIRNRFNRRFCSKYFLPQENGDLIQVCSHFLLKLFQIPKIKLYRASIALDKQPIRHRGGTNQIRIKIAARKAVVQFIEKLPRFASSHNQPLSNMYFHPQLNSIQKLYFEYQRTQIEQNQQYISPSSFRRILKQNFRFLLIPKRQTCLECKQFDNRLNSFVLSEEARSKTEEEKEAHLIIPRSVKSDLQNVVEDITNHTEVFSVDIQRSLQLPYLNETPLVFYKRPLWYFSVCLYDESRKRPHMYVWPESVSNRKTDQIASCIIEHLTNQLAEDAQKVILFCNPNRIPRNTKMALMMKKIFDINNSQLESIEQRFFHPNHTFSSCSRYFAKVESRMKSVGKIYNPAEYNNIFRETDERTEVHEMKVEQFLSSKPLENLLHSITTDSNGKYIDWSKYQRLKYSRIEPFSVECKTYQNSDETVHLSKKMPVYTFANTELSQFNCQPISTAKHNDLKDLAQEIPPEYRAFYETILHDNGVDTTDYGLCYNDDE